MTKAAKKIERRMKKAKKRQAEKEMKEKIGLFSKLEDFCLVCEKPFDKQNKEMVQSWCVVIYIVLNVGTGQTLWLRKYKRK